MIPLKDFWRTISNFWRTFEMPLINSETNLILTWSVSCFIIDAPVENQVPTYTITDKKFMFQL